jgi:hypothetical protein
MTAMLELIGRQWCWRPSEAGSMESVEEAISNVEVNMDAEQSRLEFSTNKPAFNLNIMPTIDLRANNLSLTITPTTEGHPHASKSTANVRDINKRSLTYFDVATSNIILRERNSIGIFSGRPSYTIERDDKDIYGKITSVDIHCVGEGRSFHLTGKVSLIDYKEKEIDFVLDKPFSEIGEVKTYLEEILPWSKFLLNSDYPPFSHILQFPDRIAKASTTVSSHDKKANCTFEWRSQIDKKVITALGIDADGDSYVTRDSNLYVKWKRVCSNEYGIYLIGRTEQETSLKLRSELLHVERALEAIFHPLFFDFLRGGGSLHCEKSFFLMSDEGIFHVVFSHLHIESFDEQMEERKEEHDFLVKIEDWAVIGWKLDITSNLHKHIRYVLPTPEQAGNDIQIGCICTPEGKAIGLETQNVEFQCLSKLPPMIMTREFVPAQFSKSSGNLEVSLNENWDSEEARYVLVQKPIVSPSAQWELVAPYVRIPFDNKPTSLVRLDLINSNHAILMKQKLGFNGPSERLHPSNLHRFLFPEAIYLNSEDFLRNGLPLGIFQSKWDIYCIRQQCGSLPPQIIAITESKGIVSELNLEFDEEIRSWRLPTSHQAMESNQVYSWLLSLLEVQA